MLSARPAIPPRDVLREPMAFARERGIALIVGLIILVVLSMIGVAAFSVSTQEERMAGNSRDRIRAFEAAEAALRNCEAIVENDATAFTDGTVGMYLAPPDSSSPTVTEQTPLKDEATWQDPTNNAVNRLPRTLFPDSAIAPACVAEKFVQPNANWQLGQPLNSSNSVNIAHVTAHGYGLNSNTVVRLESYYAI